ncbi:Arc family DNA-binding protein [Methylobacterium sp. P31]
MTDAKHPSDIADRFQVRMPPGLRERLAAAAKANNRSANAEIVARLQASLDEHEPDDPFLRLAASGQKEGLRQAADEIVAVVEALDDIVGPLDGEAWRAGAYEYLDGPDMARPATPYERGTVQFSSWIRGRAFAVAATLRRIVREMQGLPDEQPEEN